MSGFSLGAFLPDALHILAVKALKTRQVFCDEHSVESLTGTEKRKYKLAANIFPEMGIFTFVLSTSTRSATSAYTTICVKEYEWEEKDQEYLTGVSYFDAKKIHVHDVNEIVIKRKDATNGFKRVALLPVNIFSNLQSCFKRARCQTSVPIETRKILDAAYADASVAENALRELGLL